MSLVQEALRRKSEEDKKPAAGAPAAAPASPGTPPTGAPAKPAKPARKKSRGWVDAVVIVLCLAVIGGGGYYAFNFFMKKPAADPATTEIAAPQPAAAAVPEQKKSLAGQSIQKAANLVKSINEPLDEVLTAQGAPPREKKPAEAPAAPAAPAPVAPTVSSQPVAPAAVVPAAVSAAVPEPEAPAATVGVADRKPPVVKIPTPVAVTESKEPPAWPQLTLKGVVSYQGGGEGMAILNGKLVGPGSRIDGVTVKEILQDEVVLERDGETRSVRVGGAGY